MIIAKRLSTFIQEEKQELMTEIVIKISDFMMLKTKSKRDVHDIRNIYIYFMMYSLITKDLLLFPRIFSSLANVQAIFLESREFIIEMKPELSNAVLIKQFINFYNQISPIFNITKLALAKTFESPENLLDNYQDAILHTAKDYIK